MILLFIVFLFLFLLLLMVLPLLFIRFKSTEKRNIEEKSEILLVIAHPDDECLFFSPTILSNPNRISILCLSNGNNHRAEEFRRSCQRLKIKNFHIVDDSINLKDSQSVFWNADAIVGHVERMIHRWNISQIISFDSHGISGHRNHSSIYFALLRLRSRSSLKFYSLISIPFYQKYIFLFDFVRFIFFSSSIQTDRRYFLPVDQSFTPHRAMFEHRSQFVWFRILYLLFSRYIWINELKEIF